MEPRIIPQKFSFDTPTRYDGFGKIQKTGIHIEISFDAFRGDKEEVKVQLEAIFEQVLEYFR